jgi:hypothetical protein
MGGLPLHYLSLVVPARHTKKSQNIGVNKNIGAAKISLIFANFSSQYLCF